MFLLHYFVIGDSMVKYIRLDELSSSDRSISIIKHLGCLLEDMVDSMADLYQICIGEETRHTVNPCWDE